MAEKKTIIHPGSAENNIAFSPDSKTLASGGWEEIRLWNANTGQHIKTLTEGIKGNTKSTVFSPGGKTLATGDAYLNIHLWNHHTGQHKKTLKLSDSQNSGSDMVVFSSDGSRLASWNLDFSLKETYLWDASTGTCLQTLTDNKDLLDTVKFSSDRKTLATVSWGGIYLWRDFFDIPFDNIKELPSDIIDLSIPLKPTANEVYNNAIRSVMWIVNPGMGEGSSILIDKKFKLAITNAHITGKQSKVDIYFPAPDEKGELIKDCNFYLTSGGVLKRLGYYTKGHVVAKNEKIDLAIIRLDGLPETVRPD